VSDIARHEWLTGRPGLDDSEVGKNLAGWVQRTVLPVRAIKYGACLNPVYARLRTEASRGDYQLVRHV
jgi:hypothetical protein